MTTNGMTDLFTGDVYERACDWTNDDDACDDDGETTGGRWNSNAHAKENSNADGHWTTNRTTTVMSTTRECDKRREKENKRHEHEERGYEYALGTRVEKNEPGTRARARRTRRFVERVHKDHDIFNRDACASATTRGKEEVWTATGLRPGTSALARARAEANARERPIVGVAGDVDFDRHGVRVRNFTPFVSGCTKYHAFA